MNAAPPSWRVGDDPDPGVAERVEEAEERLARDGEGVADAGGAQGVGDGAPDGARRGGLGDGFDRGGLGGARGLVAGASPSAIGLGLGGLVGRRGGLGSAAVGLRRRPATLGLGGGSAGATGVGELRAAVTVDLRRRDRRLRLGRLGRSRALGHRGGPGPGHNAAGTATADTIEPQDDDDGHRDHHDPGKTGTRHRSAPQR